MKHLFLLFCFCLNAFANPSQQPTTFLSVKEVKPVTVKEGKVTEAKVVVQILPEFHIQANPASQPNLIPTTLVILPQNGLTMGLVTYPEGKPYRLQNSDRDLMAYDGTVELKVSVSAEKARPGKYEVPGTLKFQPCNEKICFFPTRTQVTIPVHVVKR